MKRIYLILSRQLIEENFTKLRNRNQIEIILPTYTLCIMLHFIILPFVSLFQRSIFNDFHFCYLVIY